MTTTTDPPRPPARPAGATNLRLYLVAFLASAYVLAWWLFGARAAAGSTPEPPVTRSLETDEQPRLATWFDDLPRDRRPRVDVPAGWHIADRPTAGRGTRRDVPVPVRVPSTRAGRSRIRTRSS
jgi:hypothetical protein